MQELHYCISFLSPSKQHRGLTGIVWRVCFWRSCLLTRLKLAILTSRGAIITMLKRTALLSKILSRSAFTLRRPNKPILITKQPQLFAKCLFMVDLKFGRLGAWNAAPYSEVCGWNSSLQDFRFGGAVWPTDSKSSLGNYCWSLPRKTDSHLQNNLCPSLSSQTFTLSNY